MAKKNSKKQTTGKSSSKKANRRSGEVEKTPDKVKGQRDAPLASLSEVASMLRMSPLQVRKMAQSGQIPAVKVDGEWRFNKDLVFRAIHKRSRGM